MLFAGAGNNGRIIMDMLKKYISTWLCLDDKDEESTYYQVGSNSSSPEFQAVYWKCVFVFFIYGRRFNRDCVFRLYLNKPVDPLIIEGINIPDKLKEHGVEVIVTPFTFKPPRGFHGSWRNQFYEFDIFNYIAGNSADEDLHLILDCDCIITKSLDSLFEECKSKGCITYILNYADSQMINGITRIDMKDLFDELLGRDTGRLPVYHAGEFAAFNVKTLRLLLADFESVFKKMIDKFNAGDPKKFNEEAHFLSYLYFGNGISGGEGNRYIKRMWSGPEFYNIESSDRNLAIWHLPSSKRTTFPLLFKKHEYFLSLNDKEYLKQIETLAFARNPQHQKAKYFSYISDVLSAAKKRMLRR